MLKRIGIIIFAIAFFSILKGQSIEDNKILISKSINFKPLKKHLKRNSIIEQRNYEPELHIVSSYGIKDHIKKEGMVTRNFDREGKEKVEKKVLPFKGSFLYFSNNKNYNYRFLKINYKKEEDTLKGAKVTYRYYPFWVTDIPHNSTSWDSYLFIKVKLEFKLNKSQKTEKKRKEWELKGYEMKDINFGNTPMYNWLKREYKSIPLGKQSGSF
ncbi:MAG: hypothetical protein ABEH43_08510 [Flavobacteriales bacterium]